MSFAPKSHIFIGANDKVRGSAALRKTINCHIQRELQRKRKQARIKNLTPFLWKPSAIGRAPKTLGSVKAEQQAGPQNNLKSRPDSPVGDQEGDGPPATVLPSHPSPQTLAPTPNADHPRPEVRRDGHLIGAETQKEHDIPSQSTSISLRSSSDQFSPSTILGTGCMDGYSTSRIPLTNHMKYLLHHLLTVVLPEYWTNRAPAERLVPLYLALSSAEPGVLFGHLATAATHLWVQSNSSQKLMAVQRRLQAEHIGYKREAIRLFNKRLTSAGAAFDASTFHVLMSLFVVESMSQDEAGITAHLNGFERLVTLRGDISTVPEYQRMGLTTLTYDWAIVTRSMPREPPYCIEPLRLSYEVSNILSGAKLNLQDLGEGFKQPHIISMLDPRLFGCIRQLREAMLFREFCAVSDPSLDAAQRRHFMYGSMQSRFQMLRLPFLEPWDQEEEYINRSEACRLALVFSGIIHRFLSPSSIVYKSLAAQLLTALKRSDLSSLWHPATDLLAWVLFIGAHISQGRPEEIWFQFHLARCGRCLWWREWAHPRYILMRFFYTDRLHERSFRSIWTDVEWAISGLDITPPGYFG